MTLPAHDSTPTSATLGSWSLGALLPDASRATLERHLESIKALVSEFEGWRARLEDNTEDLEASDLLLCLGDYETLYRSMVQVSAYGSLWFSSNTQSNDALAFRDRVDQALTGLRNRVLFFPLWWQRVASDTAARLLPDPQAHHDANHYLSELRTLSPFALEEQVEQAINLKDSHGIEGMLTIYAMLTNRLEFRLEVDGEIQTLTRDALLNFVYSPNPDLRAAAYRELYRVYESEVKVLAQIYSHRVRDWSAENLELRGISSPIEVRNLRNQIPASAVDALIEVCRERRGVFQRYFQLKAEWLGVKKLRRYDLYAPIVASERRMEYSEAVDEVLTTFDEFDPRLGKLAQRVFDDNHLDSELRPGKRGGAFCATVLPELTPWVLVNYGGSFRDATTLAHELGHAVHSMLAQEHSLLTQQPSLPLAETASVFAEMLMTDRLLRRETDPLVRREILARVIDDLYATVLRQAYFVLFEREAHEAIQAGGSADDLEQIYWDNLLEQFGDSVELGDEFRHEWVTIPHIYNYPFYCYAYSFGQLLVLSLYRRFQQEGEAFIPGYLRLLSHGGSAPPLEILSEVGVDPTEPDFWRSGFDVIEQFLEELIAIESPADS